MSTDTQANPAATSSSQTPKRGGGPLRLSYTHEAMVDLILQEPTVTTKELAEVFDLTPGWVSRVVASDSFQARIAERKAQLIDPVITHSLRERVQGVAVQSIAIIQEKLAAEESAAYALEALGVAAPALLGKRNGK